MIWGKDEWAVRIGENLSRHDVKLQYPLLRGVKFSLGGDSRAGESQLESRVRGHKF
jgi:hypothetical protein